MIKFKIVTPERILFDQEIESVSLPTETGEITILQNHIPLISNLISGEARIHKKDGSIEPFAVSEGTIEVKENIVTVLANTAELVSEIDIERAEKAKERARKLMSESYTDEKTFAEAAASLEKHLTRLRIAHKHRTHTTHNLESGTLNE